MNDVAVRIRLVIFGSKAQLFFTQIKEQTEGGEESGEGPTPLACYVGLTVI